MVITEREKCGNQAWAVPVGRARRSNVAEITSLLSNWRFNEEVSNIRNLSWMKTINNHFILLIAVGDISEKAFETIQRLWSQKKRTSILSCCKFWWTKHVCSPRSRISLPPCDFCSVPTDDVAVWPLLSGCGMGDWDERIWIFRHWNVHFSWDNHRRSGFSNL
jgi:hypothetical protein